MFSNFQNLQQMQSHLINSVSSNNNNNKSVKNQQYNKQLSKSFRDILENTLLINGFNDVCLDGSSGGNSNHNNKLNFNMNMNNNIFMTTSRGDPSQTPKSLSRNGHIPININNVMLNSSNHAQNPTQRTPINKSTTSLESNQNLTNGSNLTLSNAFNNINNCSSKQNMNAVSSSIKGTVADYFDFNSNSSNLLEHDDLVTNTNSNSNNNNIKNNYSASPSRRNFVNKSLHNNTQNIPATPVVVNTQLIMKFAELERTLAMTKAENNNLLEQQVNF
jgi:hypothetical protein